MALHTDTKIFKVTYDLSLLVTKLVANMPRNYKADFGADLRKQCFDLVALVYRANSASDRPPVIRILRERVVAVDLSLRLAVDLRLISRGQYGEARYLWLRVGGKIPENWWRRLAAQILFHDPRADVEVRGDRATLALVPRHKRLAEAPDHCGLPIGNLSSQFFANILLDGLDKHVKHRLHSKHYVRYVDDFVLLHPSAQWLGQALDSVNSYLPRLGLELNPRKTIIQPIDRGVDFAGHVIKPWRREVRRRSVRTAVRRIEDLPQEKVFETGNSYLGLLRHADGHRDRALIANAMRKRGHAVRSDLTKAYR